MKRIAQLLILLLICISCDNDENGNVLNLDETQIEEEAQSVGFFNLAVGNQWTYEIFRRVAQDSDEFETEDVTFTREVINEEIIDGEQVYTIEENATGNSPFGPPEGLSTYQVKDSLGFLVRSDIGVITYSSESTEDYLVFSEGFGDIFGRLLIESEVVTIEAGTFECVVNERFAVLNDGEIAPGRNNCLYAEGVGEVLTREAILSQSQHFAEVRLIDFNFPNQN